MRSFPRHAAKLLAWLVARMLVGGFALQPACGALLVYDSFSYTNDQSYYKNGGFGWGDAWGGLGVASGLSYTNGVRILASVGGSASFHITARALDTNPNGPFASWLDTNGFVGKEGTEIWISYLARPSSLDMNGAGIQFTSVATANDGTGFALWLTNGQSQFAPGVPLVLSNTYFVVEHITFQSNNIDLRTEYIGPVPGEPSPTGALVTNINSGDFTLKYVTLYNAFSQFIVDEIRIGESYADVAPLPLIVLTNLQLSAGQFGFNFVSRDGKTHEVEATTNLQIGSWENVTNLTGDGSTKWLFHSVTNAESQFFRVRTH